jgi:glycogen(starch) synthase
VRHWVASSPQLGGPVGQAAATGGVVRGKTELFEIDAAFRSPYGDGEAVGEQGGGSSLTSLVQGLSARGAGGRGGGESGSAGSGGPGGPFHAWSGWLQGLAAGRAEDLKEVIDSIGAMKADSSHYGTDLMGDADRYAKVVAALAMRTRFDVIHAHDWLTYPAGLAVKALTGKPLVCHVHATEFDRSGDSINQQVYDIERAGIARGGPRDRGEPAHADDRGEPVRRADPAKVDVIYNGVENAGPIANGGPGIASDDKIVLFLGRITLQKGPEYFIRAAKRVLEKVEKVKFVVAGSGDMAVRMIEEAAALGIGHKVLFTGFLRGRDVQRVFRMADCYVMPSVSEPFGIAALEAMQQDTPVIISKQSGVSEVLSHALKVDFWDVDDMANKIVAVLKYPPLSQTLREHGAFEVRHLTWDGAAEKATKTYGRAIGGA